MSDFIQFKQVSRWFDSAAGRFNALDKINLVFRQGEYAAIVGKSGSGKSTFLNILTGIDFPDEGSVRVENTNIRDLNETALAGWRGRTIGIVFQFFQLIPTLTVQENILLAMEFVNTIPKKERLDRAGALLKQVGILSQANKLPAALSGGEQQRAAIARALANDPPILAADEPTGNLDTKTADLVRGLFAELKAAGKTVLVVTHEHVSNKEFDRVITFQDGAVVADTTNTKVDAYAR